MRSVKQEIDLTIKQFQFHHFHFEQSEIIIYCQAVAFIIYYNLEGSIRCCRSKITFSNTVARFLGDTNSCKKNHFLRKTESLLSADCTLRDWKSHVNSSLRDTLRHRKLPFYRQTHSPTVVQGGGGLIRYVTIFRKAFTFSRKPVMCSTR